MSVKFLKQHFQTTCMLTFYKEDVCTLVRAFTMLINEMLMKNLNITSVGQGPTVPRSNIENS